MHPYLAQKFSAPGAVISCLLNWISTHPDYFEVEQFVFFLDFENIPTTLVGRMATLYLFVAKGEDGVCLFPRRDRSVPLKED
jgi:hypothetical protein